MLEVANEPFNSHWGVIPDIAEEQIENSNQPVSSDRWRLTDATPHRLDRSSGSLDLGPTDFDPRVEIVKQLRPSVLLEDTEPISADRRQSLPDPALNTDKPQLELEIIRAPERVWHGGLRTSSSQETIGEDILLLEEQTAAPVHALPQLPELVDQREPILLKSDECSRLQNFPTTQITPKVRKADVDGSLRRRGRRKIVVQKHLTQAAQVSLNGLCIFATWWWSQYYYILLPLITATVALNVIMVAAILARRTWNAVVPEKIIMPKGPESMVLLVPCYNETEEELIKSLDSLTSQTGIEKHKQAIIIVCDGKVRGPGMAKTTADYLLLDILTHKTERRYLTAAYTAWDQGPMDVVVQRGLYNGLPYYCIIKQQNQGKRDGLIVARSFLYNFNRRNSAPNTVFSPEFFNHMATFLLADANIENVTHLIGMDADTVFDERCIWELLQQSRYADTVGVCGYVAVDWKASHWDLWRLYQSAEYTIAQGLRRLHQSLVTHKVSCLPGCCQLLRICEETCGDYVLLELFGYCPELDDSLLKQIRATASEDRNHVCHMLSARPQSQTRQALAAKAYTDVPRSWSVFLSQRRRWTLGATSNDLMLVFAGGVQWFERITAAINVLTWTLNPFIFASLASFIFAITCKSLQGLTPQRHANNSSGAGLADHVFCSRDADSCHLLHGYTSLVMLEVARTFPILGWLLHVCLLWTVHQHFRAPLRLHIYGLLRLGQDTESHCRGQLV